MLPTLPTPRLSPNHPRSPGTTLSNLSSPRSPFDEYSVNATKAMRFAYATPSRPSLGPLHTEKALVKRYTPKFPKRNKSANKDRLVITEGMVDLDIDTAMLPNEPIDPKLLDIQNKIEEQLKGKPKFQMLETKEMDLHAFSRTLKRHGLDLAEDECNLLFKHYDKDGGGTVDYKEFFKGLRGSDFVQTSKSYGFETPDPHYHDELIGGGYGHYFPISADLPPRTPRAFKAWLQQYSSDKCPFGTDRKIFGGTWQYRTSLLMHAHPIVSPRYGKTGFPARKTLGDIIHVISDKISERSTSKFAFSSTFRQFDRNGDGVIDREEFEKVLDKYNIELNTDEMERLFTFFCVQDGGIRYVDLVNAIEDNRRRHPLGGYCGTGFGIKP